MKSKFIAISLCLIMIILSGCQSNSNNTKASDNNSVESSSKNEASKTDDDNENIDIDYENEKLGFNSSGDACLMAGDGKGNVYFRSELDSWFLYKAKMDGTGKTKICEDAPDEINILDDYIYYTNFRDDFNVYRIKTDGTGREKLINRYCSDLLVTENYMYMGLRDEKNESYVYRANLDGSNLELLISGMGLSTYYNGIIYCSDAQNLYSYDLRDSELKKIIDEYTHNVSVDDKGIYFWLPDKNEYCMINKNGEITTIIKGLPQMYCKYGDRVYYNGYSKDDKKSECIYYTDLKTGNEVMLYEFSNQCYDRDGNIIELTKQDIRSGNFDEKKYLNEDGELDDVMSDRYGLMYVVDGVFFTRAVFRENKINGNSWDCLLKISDDGTYQIFD